MAEPESSKTRGGMDVRARIKEILRSGFQEILEHKWKLEARRSSLLEEVEKLNECIASLDRELAEGVRDGLKELNLAPAAVEEQPTTRRFGRRPVTRWILELLATQGPLSTAQINVLADAEGLNPKSVTVKLCTLSQGARVRAEKVPGLKGRRYSLAEPDL